MIFYSDIDDTLMKSGKVSLKTNEFLKNINYETLFVPCSGRPTSNLINTFSKYKIKYVVGFNGGEVYDLESKKIIYKNGLDIEEAKKVINVLNELNIDYILYDEDKLYTNNLNNEYAQVESELTFLDIFETNKPMESTKILGLYDPEKIDIYIDKLRNEFPDLEIAKSKPFFIEITKKGVTKGDAILYLNNMLQIDISKTYVFGDSDNDISMFELPAKKIAVKNANENISKRADEICDSCENDGVVKYIENIIKEN